MENQKVKDVKSLFSILTSMAEVYPSIQDMKAISMFPGYSGELASVNTVYNDVLKENEYMQTKHENKRKGILQFFQF
jgi:hypothetical protein